MRRRWIALLVGIAITVAGCTGAGKNVQDSAASSNAPLDRDPNTLVVAVDAVTGDFDPASSYLVNAAVITRGVYQGLLQLKGESASEVEGVLADRWEHNADSSVWTFHLRPGVKFSDGTPLTAQAVKANYVRMITIALGTEAILGSFLPDPGRQIEAVDPQTVRFHLAYPYPRFEVVLAAQYGVGLVSAAVFRQHSTGRKDQGHEWLQSHAVGTGAYLLQEFTPDQAVLVRNPGYWGGWSGAHFDRVIIKAVPEASTRRQLLESGDVDIAYAGPADDTAAVREDTRFQVGQFKNLDHGYIILGEYGPLASPQARQAMN